MRQIKVFTGLYHGRISAPRKATGSALLPEEEALYSELKATGISILPDYFSSEQTAELKVLLDHELDRIGADQWRRVLEDITLPANKYGVSLGNAWHLWSDRNFSDQRISRAENMHALIRAFGSEQSFLNIGRAYLEREISLRFCMANRTRFVENNLGSGGGWHRDMHFKRGFKALVYLVDVDETNGCFQYLPGSSSMMHHLFKTPSPDKYQFTHEEVLAMLGGDEGKIMNVTGKAGTVVLFDTNGIHRGRPIERGSRYAITNYYHDG